MGQRLSTFALQFRSQVRRSPLIIDQKLRQTRPKPLPGTAIVWARTCRPCQADPNAPTRLCEYKRNLISGLLGLRRSIVTAYPPIAHESRAKIVVCRRYGQFWIVTGDKWALSCARVETGSAHVPYHFGGLIADRWHRI